MTGKAPPSRRCDVAILAGGMGTRLKSRAGSLPKPMVPILGKPVLEHLIDMCRRDGLVDIALLVHFQHEAISDYFGDGAKFGVRLTYCVEQAARGTGGALRDALDVLADRFVVIYGDTYADIDLRALSASHATGEATATLLLHPNDHPHDSDLVEIDGRSDIVAIHPYPHAPGTFHANLVNAALYVVERERLAQFIPADRKSDLAKDVFPSMLVAGLRLKGYVTPEYIKDMGTPDRLDKVERDVLAGLPERLSSRQLRSAVFLDRDGTLNAEVDHLRDPEQLVLLDGVGEGVRALNRSGILAICVTNQPVVARGGLSLAGLDRVHARLGHLLGEHGAYLDRIYVCPHHPDRGFAGEIPELKMHCNCRKPGTGMFDQAVSELALTRQRSWMIGDTTSDIRAGKRAGVRTILVQTGYAGKDRKYDDKPDFIVPDFQAAVRCILDSGEIDQSQEVSIR